MGLIGYELSCGYVLCILTALINISFMHLFTKSLESSNIVGNICESPDITVANINRLPIELKFRGTINHISSLKRHFFHNADEFNKELLVSNNTYSHGSQ